MTNSRLEGDRVALAILAGVGTGAGITTLPALAAPSVAVLVFFVAAAAWAVGILVLGGPVWVVLHRLGKRGPWTAVLTGAAVTFSGAAAIVAVGTYGQAFTPGFGTVAGCGLLAAVGAVVGFVIWDVAYREAGQ